MVGSYGIDLFICMRLMHYPYYYSCYNIFGVRECVYCVDVGYGYMTCVFSEYQIYKFYAHGSISFHISSYGWLLLLLKDKSNTRRKHVNALHLHRTINMYMRACTDTDTISVITLLSNKFSTLSRIFIN